MCVWTTLSLKLWKSTCICLLGSVYTYTGVCSQFMNTLDLRLCNIIHLSELRNICLILWVSSNIWLFQIL